MRGEINAGSLSLPVIDISSFQTDLAIKSAPFFGLYEQSQSYLSLEGMQDNVSSPGREKEVRTFDFSFCPSPCGEGDSHGLKGVSV